MDIIEQIRAELNKRGISLWKFARMLGVPEQSVYSWFNYQRNPSLVHLIDMAYLLGCEIELKKVDKDENKNQNHKMLSR